jgi:hypothetical protein
MMIDLKKFARIELSPLPTLSRFFVVQLLSAAATLLICPQFGMGPLGGGHGISGWVMQYGSFACGAFCGAVFYGLATVISFSVMRREEAFWLKRNQSSVLSSVFILLFAVLMVTKWSLGLSSSHESFSYYFAWIMIGSLSMFLMTKVTTQWRLN